MNSAVSKGAADILPSFLFLRPLLVVLHIFSTCWLSHVLGSPMVAPEPAGGHLFAGRNGADSRELKGTKLIAASSATQAPPVITVQPSSQAVKQGDTVVLGVTATGMEPLTYQWRKGGGDIPGVTSSVYTTNNVQSLHAGVYRVKARTWAGNTLNDPTTLTVSGGGGSVPLITADPLSQTLFAGNNLILGVSADGPAPLSYQWRFNGDPIAGQTNMLLFLPITTTGNSGNYSVAVTNFSGAVTSAVANVVVNPLPPNRAVVGWGYNYTGQTTVPAGLSGVVALAAGINHSLALKSDGIVVAWGNNENGQLNVPVGLSGVATVAACIDHSLALKSDGIVVAWGNHENGQLNVPVGLSGVVAVAAGYGHSLALKSDGTVAAWGRNDLGQLNVPVGLSGVAAVAAGYYHNLALKSDGTVVAWGWNGYGQLNVPLGLGGVAAVAAGNGHSLAIKSDGTVVAWGSNDHGLNTVPSGLSGVAAVAAGNGHSLALKSDGTVAAWGLNDHGQTNVPSGLIEAVAVAAGSYHSLALMSGPPAIVEQPLSQTVAAGENVTLFVRAGGPEPLSYQWRKSVISDQWSVISGATNSLLSIPKAQLRDVGDYSVIITNSLGGIASAVATLTIPILQLASQGTGIIQADPAKSTYIAGEGVTLSAVPGRYYNFGRWGDGNTQNPRSFIVGTSNVFTAIFTNTVPLEKYIAKPWDKSFGGTGLEDFHALRVLPDGNVLVGGVSASGVDGNKGVAGLGLHDFWLLKIDTNGHKIWEKALGGSSHDDLWIIQTLPDGSILLGGASYSSNDGNKTARSFGNADVWLVKLDANGIKIWDKAFGGSSYDDVYVIQPLPDGGFLLAGSTFSGKGGNKSSATFGSRDAWLVKVDSDGNKVWDKAFGGHDQDWFSAIQPSNDGGFLLGGTSFSGASGNKSAPTLGSGDMWLVKVDSEGNKIWDQAFGGTGVEELKALVATPDGGFLLGGSATSGVDGNKGTASFGALDFWLIKVDADGNELWERAYGGSNSEQIGAIQPLADGGFLLGGMSASAADGNKSSPGFGNYDFWLVRVDAVGIKLWERSFGGEGSDLFQALELTPDGGFVLGGSSELGIGGNKTSSSFGQMDFWLVKVAEAETPVGTPLILVNWNDDTNHTIPATNRVSVTVSTTLPGGHLFYTNDGSEPDSGSTEYLSPFGVTNSQVIRAIAYSSDFLRSQLADPVSVTLVPVYSFILTSTGGGTATRDVTNSMVLSNSVVTLTATPANGWTFISWAGDAAGSQNPLEVVVNANKSIRAVFGTALAITTVGGGTVSANPLNSLYAYGSSVRLSAVPDTGKFFRFWSGAPAGISNSPIVFAVTNPTPTVSAVFASLSIGTVALNTLITGEGTVTKNPQFEKYTIGAAVTLAATPTLGSRFAGWSGDASGAQNPLSLLMSLSKNVTANFVSSLRGVTIDSPASGAEFAAPATVKIDAGVVDFTPTKVEFFDGNTKVGEDLSSPFSFVWSNVAVGSYTLTAKATDASASSLTSSPITVAVSAPPKITTQPLSTSVVVGENAEFFVAATGKGPLSYQWLANGVVIPAATSSTYSLTAATGQLGTTSYRVVVTNSVGSVSSDVAVLTVGTVPVQTITFAPLPDRTLKNPPFTLTATASSGLPVSFALVSGPARLTNGVVYLTGTGAVVVRATQPGNGSVKPASSVDRSFNVNLPTSETEALDQGRVKVILPYATAVAGLQYSIERPPSSGTLILQGNQFTYTSDPSFFGPTDFRYRIFDTVTGIETPGILVNLDVRRVDPIFFLEKAVYTVGEADGFVTINIRKNVSAAGRVLLITRDVTAARVVGGVGDFELLQTFLDFESGETSKRVVISIVNDQAFEGNETFEFEISVTSPASVATPSSATIIIVEDDSGLVSTETRSPDPIPVHEARLQVGLNPPGVDGRWRFVGQHQWSASGATSGGLPEGNYEIEFKPAQGFAHPLPVVVGLTNGLTAFHAAYYTATPYPRLGILNVLCAGTALGGWKFEQEADAAYRPSGDSVFGLNAGTYTLQFKPVDGLITPGNANVEVKFQTTNVYSATYLAAPPVNSTRIKPTPMLLEFLQYPYVGEISRGDGELGSGFVVKERVVLTAAHVLFDSRTLSTARRVRWHFQKYRGAYEPKPQTPRGWNLYAGYAAQRTNEGVNALSTPFSQNLDVAAMFFTEAAGRGGYGGYLASVDKPNPWLTGTDEKILSGYPIDGILSADQEKIHETTPARVSLIKVPSLIDGFLYGATQLLSYPGNSGGPLCVRYSNGKFYPAGVFVALDADRIYVRSLDFKTVEMIAAAELSGKSGTNATGGGVIDFSSSFADTGDDIGFLQVALAPLEALDAGGGWRLVGGSPAYISAPNSITRILTFGYELEFKPVKGFVAPSNIVVQVVKDTTNSVLARYLEVMPAATDRPALSFNLQTGLTLAGKIGTNYRIEVADSLMDPPVWATLITVTANNTFVIIPSTAPSSQGARFYRAAALTP